MRKTLIGLIAASLLLVANESMALTMYGGVGRGSAVNRGGLLIVDQNTGVGTLVGNPITDLELSEGLTGGLTGIAFDSTGTLFGSTIIGPPEPERGAIRTSTLIRIDPDTGALNESIGAITVDGVPISIGDLAFQPRTDVLYGIRSNADRVDQPDKFHGGELYKINKVDGAATLVGVTEADTGGGLAFAPDGTLYFARLGDNSSALLELDPSDASTIPNSDVPLSIFFDGLAVRSDGTLFAHATADVNGSSDDRRGEIYTIDPTTGISTFVGNTGAGSPSDLGFRPAERAIIDLDPDVFEVAVKSYGEQEMSGKAYITAYIKLPDEVNVADIVDTTVTLSVNGTTLATADPAILDNLLVVQFPLTPDNVGAILGIEVIYVEVDVRENRIKVEATTPAQPTDLIELIVSGDLISGGSFSGTDAVRLIPGTLEDTTPPTIEGVKARPKVLWFPHRKMVSVTVNVSVSDDSDGAPSCQIIAVSSNEPVSGVGYRNTAPDWKVTGDLTVKLRAERSRKGDGRVYTITVQCNDASGNHAIESVNVTVPHHKWKFKHMIKWKKHHRLK